MARAYGRIGFKCVSTARLRGPSGQAMHEIIPRVTQLEKVAALLDERLPYSSRIALILADNFVEVVMHRRCRDEFAADALFRRRETSRWSARRREQILRSEFKDKVNFVKGDLGLLDADDAAFFKFAHELRNAAYHADEYQFDIIDDIARTYFAKACFAYPKLRGPGIGFSNSEAEKKFLERHGLSDSFDFATGGDFERLCEKLAGSRPCPVEQLATSLSENLVRRIDRITGTEGEYGVLDEVGDRQLKDETDKDALLKRIQFTSYFVPRETPTNTDEEFRAELARWDLELAAFAPPVTLGKLDRWRTTARSITGSASAELAVTRYESVDRDFSVVEELANEALAEFERWVDLELARRRGN